MRSLAILRRKRSRPRFETSDSDTRRCPVGLRDRERDSNVVVGLHVSRRHPNDGHRDRRGLAGHDVRVEHVRARTACTGARPQAVESTARRCHAVALRLARASRTAARADRHGVGGSTRAHAVHGPGATSPARLAPSQSAAGAGSLETQTPNVGALMRCFSCGGPAHPATGCQYTETLIMCGPCTREFWAWMRRHTSRRWGGRYFYEDATRWRAQEPEAPAKPEGPPPSR